jgi:hypothetical protein
MTTTTMGIWGRSWKNWLRCGLHHPPVVVAPHRRGAGDLAVRVGVGAGAGGSRGIGAELKLELVLFELDLKL